MTDDVAHARAAGIDISKTDAKVCLRVTSPAGRVALQERVFAADAASIQELRVWLVDQRVECVVMEATSSYWKPFFYGLETGPFEVLLANPRQVKQLKGRKTDRADAAWLAKLAALGVVVGSFVPPPEVRDLRLAVRTRARLVRQATAQSAQLEKLLEDTSVKLSAVSSRLLTRSGRRILNAIRDGETNPDTLARLSRLKTPADTLRRALDGHVRTVHRDLIRVHLNLVDQLTTQISEVEKIIDTYSLPFRDAIQLLTSIPGISTRLATALIAETGPDMTIFPTPGRLVSWAGLAPGLNESAGKAKRAAVRQGNQHVKAAATMAAMATIQQTDTFFGTRYRRIRSRRGHGVALVAVARSILVAVWTVLHTRQAYHDLGADWYERALTDKQRRARLARAETILKHIGVQYTLHDNDGGHAPATEAA
jgi:transposase